MIQLGKQITDTQALSELAKIEFLAEKEKTAAQNKLYHLSYVRAEYMNAKVAAEAFKTAYLDGYGAMGDTEEEWLDDVSSVADDWELDTYKRLKAHRDQAYKYLLREL